jgi:hypothetical protein
MYVVHKLLITRFELGFWKENLNIFSLIFLFLDILLLCNFEFFVPFF